MLAHSLARLRAFVDTNAIGRALIVPGFALLALAMAALIGSLSEPKASVAKPWAEFHAETLSEPGNDFTVTSGKYVDYFHHRDTEVDQFVEMVDGFLDFLNAEFIPIRPERRFSVFVSENRAQHALNSAVLFGQTGPSMGTYHHKHDVLATYATTGPGTVTSLLLYPILRTEVGNLPRWADQAVATFFEKTFAFRYPDGALGFRAGYQNPWRVIEVQYGPDLRLAQIIEGAPDVTQSHYRLIAMFLWRHGYFDDFLKCARDKDLRGRENYVAAAFGLSMADVETRWRAYLAELRARSGTVLKTPVSQIFESEAELDLALGGLAEPGGGLSNSPTP